MGNYDDDFPEYRKRIGKSFANGDMLEFGEAVRDAAPDVAFRYAAPAAVAITITAAGGVAGAAAGGTFTASPHGVVVGGAGGATLGALCGVAAAGKVSESYRSKSTEDRERVRSLTGSAIRTVMTGVTIGAFAGKFRPKAA